MLGLPGCRWPRSRVVDRSFHRLANGRRSCMWRPEALGYELADDAAAEADGDGMGARAQLELGEEVPDVGLHGFLGQEEALADLAVHETVGDELEHLDLAHGRLLLQLPKGALERDDLGAAVRPAPCGDLFEATRMVPIAVEDLLALSSVHGGGIGGSTGPL